MNSKCKQNSDQTSFRYRINRAIAQTGFCSRRRADELIKSGHVQVNGKKITDFNFLIDLKKDKLTINGKSISEKKFDYIALNKPKGIVTTCDDERNRKDVLSLLPFELRHLKPVGRLDMDAEGLLILTNDGALAQLLTHPKAHVSKHYQVVVSGLLSDAALQQLSKGITLSEGLTQPLSVELLERHKDSSRLSISLGEGRNRQIKRICAKLGYPVIHLLRVAVGELQLSGLKPGHWRHLTAREVALLKSG